jgi:hypothetical protein
LGEKLEGELNVKHEKRSAGAIATKRVKQIFRLGQLDDLE